MIHIEIYRVFFPLLDRQAPAQDSASGASHAACAGRFNSWSRELENNRSDNNLLEV